MTHLLCPNRGKKHLQKGWRESEEGLISGWVVKETFLEVHFSVQLFHMCVVLGTSVNQTKLYLQSDSVTLVKSVKSWEPCRITLLICKQTQLKLSQVRSELFHNIYGFIRHLNIVASHTRNIIFVAFAAETARKPKIAMDILCFHITSPGTSEKILKLSLKRTKILHPAAGFSWVEFKGQEKDWKSMAQTWIQVFVSRVPCFLSPPIIGFCSLRIWPYFSNLPLDLKDMQSTGV